MNERNPSFTIFRHLLLAAAILFFLGCATIGGRPDWVENPNAKYPAQVYMSGLGEGRDMASAAAAATTDLSAVFESQVEATTKVRERLEENAQGSVFTSVTDIDVAIRTAQLIEGVKIAERWQDPSGQHYALAVLERNEASRDLADRLRANEQALRTKMNFASSLTTPLERFRALIPTAELAVERDVWAAQYRVLSDDYWNASPATATVENAMEEALAAASFVVIAGILEESTGKTSANQTFTRAIGDAVNESGFRVNRDNEGNLLIFSLITLSEPFKRGNNNWHHYLWDVSLEVSANEPDARAFFIVEDSGSTSHPNASTARRAAIEQAEKSILRQFNDEFGEYLNQSD